MTTRNTNETLKIINHHLQEQFPNTKIELREIPFTHIVITTPIAITTIVHTRNQKIAIATRGRGTEAAENEVGKLIDLTHPNSINELNEIVQQLYKLAD